MQKNSRAETLRRREKVANKPEYWNVGIVEYWERTAAKSLKMRASQDRFVALKPIIP